MLLLCFDGIKTTLFTSACRNVPILKSDSWMDAARILLTFQRESRDELAKYGAISIASNRYTDKFFVCGASPPLDCDFSR